MSVKILVLNGSPHGKNSATLHTVLYLQALHPEHDFTILHVGQRIRQYEADFTPVRQALEQAELILFCYPVYTFIAPYQVHRLIELIKADGVDLSGKYMSQITTSKHFYDITAHRYIQENGFDLHLHVIRGLSADMEDLLQEKGREEARMFFEQLLFACENQCFLTPPAAEPAACGRCYRPALPSGPKTKEHTVVLVTNCAEDDQNLQGMMEDFRAALPWETKTINLREFPFAGGCLGCFGCAVTGKCVYKDGFDEFLRREIQTADAIVYAFTISDHYTHSSFKCYDDRQFCNGHRTVTHGTPVAYLIAGPYRQESNLQTIVEARSEVGGNYLCGVATDEEAEPSAGIRRLSDTLVAAVRQHWRRPANFYGVGGMKIFRDLIYQMQGLMKADHRYYKEHGVYDFPQKRKGTILKMKLVGWLLSVPSAQKKIKGQLSDYMAAPYQKVIADVRNTDEAHK